ncbi:helix-turn-helix transcriptional regulator [Diaphorobacter nitroreducens]|uniref:helix-turn-helix transcriptional regulator n=1 Tax=Diaphorobacter nitroreducens TaxID=164759 RepID=UPI0028968870|nr:helix-turn-helix transcriptional regulator [Diaphorobacter nitroreducens]
MHFPLHFSSQLRQHLRALRKARGLTQADLGRLLGVGQARIAEIENNPGVVSIDQMMKVLSALRASLTLHDDGADAMNAQHDEGVSKASSSAPRTSARKHSTPLTAKAPAKGNWDLHPMTGGGKHPPTSVLATRLDAKSSHDGQALRDANPHLDVQPTSRRNYIIRPKKGSW